jgi:hypothetical protein
MDNKIQSFIKTDNNVKIELHKKDKKDRYNKYKQNNNIDQINQNDQHIDDENYVIPRYGTTVDLKSNKLSNETDKYNLRDQTPIITDNSKYRISRISIDSRNRKINPKNIISNYIEISNPFIFTQGSDILQIQMPLNHNLVINSTITISNVLSNKINTNLLSTDIDGAQPKAVKFNTKREGSNPLNPNYYLNI